MIYMYQKSKILVTGGAGFIGANLAQKLLDNGHEVIILDDLSGGFEENIPSGAKFINGSINDLDLVNRIFKDNSFDYIYHLAAYAAEGLSHFIKKFNYENNLIGSINLINASVNNGVKCFIFTSSIAVYGANQVPMKEDAKPFPEDSYGISKYAVELELESCKKMFDMDYIIFRPHNVYGEMQNIGDKYRNVIGIFMNQMMQQQPLTVFGDGNQKRAFTYIKDVVDVMAKAPFIPEAYNQIFNIGADEPYTINELIDAVANAMNVKPKIINLDARNEVMIAYSDHQKAKDILGYKTSVSLSEDVSKMGDWAKKVGVKSGNKFEKIEIRRNLPPTWNE